MVDVSVVYVVQDQPQFNVLPARRYGELIALVPGNLVVNLDSDSFVRDLAGKLSGFSPDDYLLCIGDATLIGIACAICDRATGGRFNLLKWDTQERDYYVVRVNIARALDDAQTAYGVNGDQP
jgi:hypothetical protein